MSNTETLEQFKARQAAEYGQFVATQRITHNGALAYRAGDRVPASNVALHGYDKQGLVKKVEPADTSTTAAETPQATPAAPASDKK